MESIFCGEDLKLVLDMLILRWILCIKWRWYVYSWICEFGFERRELVW